MNCCGCNDIVGYRFHPTDKQLIDHYLWNKALDRDSAVQAIGEVVGDLCDWEPRELTGFSVRRSNDQTWYLFSRRNHSKRVKRTTKLGYWKLTGKHRNIKANVGIGTKKTLVFYEGRVPKGKWTPWVIHEYTLPDTLPNQKGFFLCKLRRKDDEKVGISSGEEGQPSNVADDKFFDNSLDINVDELLAQLGETNGSNEVASAQKPEMYREKVPSCNSASFLYNPSDDFDGVQNQSSTNEQNALPSLMHEEHVPSILQSQMQEEHVPSCNDVSFFCAFNGNFDEIQHQSSTNEQDNEIQHQSSTNEQDDEFWNNIFNDYDANLDERSNELFVGSESSGLLVGRNLPIESSRKRLRIDDGVLNDVIETEVSQAREGKRKEGERLEFFPLLPFLSSAIPPTKTSCVAENSRYGQALGTSSMFIHTDSNLFLEMSLVEAPNVTLFAVDHNLHSSERRLDILNEFRKVSAPSFDFVADVPFICAPKYSVATRMYSSQNQLKLPIKYWRNLLSREFRCSGNSSGKWPLQTRLEILKNMSLPWICLIIKSNRPENDRRSQWKNELEGT